MLKKNLEKLERQRRRKPPMPKPMIGKTKQDILRKEEKKVPSFY